MVKKSAKGSLEYSTKINEIQVDICLNYVMIRDCGTQVTLSHDDFQAIYEAQKSFFKMRDAGGLE